MPTVPYREATVATVADPTAFLERLFMAKLLDFKAEQREELIPPQHASLLTSSSQLRYSAPTEPENMTYSNTDFPCSPPEPTVSGTEMTSEMESPRARFYVRDHTSPRDSD